MPDSPSKGRQPQRQRCTRRVPATPLTSEISRQSKIWNKQKEEANKTHDHKAVGFVFEVFIPVEGKDQREDPEVLTAREAIAEEPVKISLAAPSPCASGPTASQGLSTRRFSAGRNHFQAVPCPVPAAGGLSGTSLQHPHVELDPPSQGKGLLVREFCSASGRAPGEPAQP